jgi:CheY-like chemotaxis protein
MDDPPPSFVHMAMVPNIAPGERVFRPLMRAVRRAASTGTSCPACGSTDVRRSLRRSFFDYVLACFFLVPFRCRACRARGARFFRLWRPAFRIPAEPLRTSLLIMPRPLPEIDGLEPHLPEPPRPRPVPRLVGHPRPRSVLLLESDPSIRKLLRRLLDRRGYFTHEVMDAEDLGTELRERRVDLLVIADEPNSALELASVHTNLKILALSMDPQNGAEFPGRCLALAKPFASQMFLESVDRLLEFETPPDSGIAL